MFFVFGWARIVAGSDGILASDLTVKPFDYEFTAALTLQHVLGRLGSIALSVMNA